MFTPTTLNLTPKNFSFLLKYTVATKNFKAYIALHKMFPKDSEEICHQMTSYNDSYSYENEPAYRTTVVSVLTVARDHRLFCIADTKYTYIGPDSAHYDMQLDSPVHKFNICIRKKSEFAYVITKDDELIFIDTNERLSNFTEKARRLETQDPYKVLKYHRKLI